MYRCQNWRTLPVPVSSTATGAGLAPTFRNVFSASGLKTCTPCTPKLQLSPAAGCCGCRVPGARARCRPGTEQTGHFSKQLLWGQRHWRAWHWLGVWHMVWRGRAALYWRLLMTWVLISDRGGPPPTTTHHCTGCGHKNHRARGLGSGRAV